MISKRRKIDLININISNSTQSKKIMIENADSFALSVSTSFDPASSLNIFESNAFGYSPTSLPSSSPSVLSAATSTLAYIEKKEEILSCCNRRDIFKTDHSIKLLNILNNQRNEKSMCDYEIRINGESLYCHKCVLIAMSDFFSVMLTGMEIKLLYLFCNKNSNSILQLTRVRGLFHIITKLFQ